MGFNIKKFVPKTNTGKGIKKGTFDSFNPKKYVGERPIIYRSSWELKFMRLCEFNPEIIEWSSESVVIPYTLRELSKITNKCENAISIDYTKYPFYNYYLIDPKGVLLSGKNSCYIEPYITCSNTNYTNYLEPLQPININTTNYYV